VLGGGGDLGVRGGAFAVTLGIYILVSSFMGGDREEEIR